MFHLRAVHQPLFQAWEECFSDIDNVKVSLGDAFSAEFLAENESINALVSPANSRGALDGGFDRTIRSYFGNQLEHRLMQRIENEYSNGLLPVGSALLIDTTEDLSEQIRHLVVAPTMRHPSPMPHSRNAFEAFMAVLRTVSENPEITGIIVPGLCTGCGMMSPEDCAFQMRAAYEVFMYGASIPEEIINKPLIDSSVFGAQT